MKSLTEQQLRDLLKKAWDGGYDEGLEDDGDWRVEFSTPKIERKREELFTKLIASV